MINSYLLERARKLICVGSKLEIPATNLVLRLLKLQLYVDLSSELPINYR
jgi:hypothetical protein